MGPQMNMFSSYPGFHIVQSALAEFFRIIDSSKMWGYNILGDNKGRISHILRLYPITSGGVVLASKLILTKRENHYTILTMKRMEQRQFIDAFGLNIEDNQSRVIKRKVYFFLYWFYTMPFIWKSTYRKASSKQRV